MKLDQAVRGLVRWSLALGLCAVTGLVGCDDSGGGGGGADGGISTSNNPPVSAPTVQSFITSFCNFIKPCCQQAGLRADGAQCTALLGAFVGSATYNAKAGGQCLGDMKAASNQANFCADPFGTTESCDSVIATTSTGIKQPGETCTDDQDCAPSKDGDVECQSARVNNQNVEKCQVQKRGKEGDTPCVGTRDGSTTNSSFDFNATDVPALGYICHVADGLYCNSTSHLCTKIQPVGGPCTTASSYVCVATAYCDTQADLCVAKKGAGADCRTFGDECLEGHYCNDTTDKCAVQVQNGGACTTNAECTSGDCVNDKCAPTSNFALQLYCGEL